MRRALQILIGAVTLATSLMAQGSVSEIAYDSVPNFLKLPDHIHMGEAAGVATNSKGNIFVYSRTGAVATAGGSRMFSHGGSRLFEFDRSGKYVREIGQGVYGFLFAQSVRVDSRDNIWVVDRGASMVLKFDPEGRLAMTLGRKPEAVTSIGTGAAAPTGPAAGGRGAGPAGGRGGGGALPGAGVPGDNFNRPTDVAWDAAGNIFVADGFGNALVATFDRDGKYLKSWGSRGTEQGQLDTLLSIATDASGNVFVADRGNRRIQVFDNDGKFLRQISDVGAPWAICISPGAHQYLYSSNSNDVGNLDGGEIYKLELDGKVLGKFGRAGKLIKEFGTVNQMDCRNPNELYVGELINWRVQKVSLRAK